MSALLRILLLGVIAQLWPALAHACSCIRSNLEERLRTADGVMLVEVLKVRRTLVYFPIHESLIPERGLKVKVRVVRSWKGAARPNDEITLHTQLLSSACGYPVAPGGRIVVFSYRSDLSDLSICNASRPGEEAAMTAALEALSRTGEGADGT